jgi:hypothetical protein
MTNTEDFDDDPIIDEIANKLEQNELDKAKDEQEFRDRYNLLIDCTVDEINEEIHRRKLDGYTFMLAVDGTQPVYKKGLLTTANFMGGEDFALKKAQRLVDSGNSKSLIGFLLEPKSYSSFDYLVVSYADIGLMAPNFGATLAVYLVDIMSSIEKDVFKLRVEMDDRHRTRQLELDQEPNEVYLSAGSW